MIEVKHAEFGKMIRELRMACKPKLSLRKLAARCNISAAYLSNIERGYCPPPSAEVVKALARELGESPAKLLLIANRVDNSLLDGGINVPAPLVTLFRLLDMALIRDTPDDEYLSLKNLMALLIAEFEVKNWEDIDQLEILAHSATAYAQLKQQTTNPSPEVATKLEYGTEILKSFMPGLYIETEQGDLLQELRAYMDAQKKLTSSSSDQDDLE